MCFCGTNKQKFVYYFLSGVQSPHDFLVFKPTGFLIQCSSPTAFTPSAPWEVSSKGSSSLVEDGGATATCSALWGTTSLFTSGSSYWPTASTFICFAFYFLALCLHPQRMACSHHALPSWKPVELLWSRRDQSWRTGAAWCLPWTARPAGSPNSSDDIVREETW